MKTLDNFLISEAIKAIKSSEIEIDGYIPKEMNGYVSTFGAAVVLSGLIPAIIFFGADKTDKQKAPERPKMIKALVQVINAKRTTRNKSLLTTELTDLVDTLLKSKDLNTIQKEFSDAAIAIKLALRMYKPRT